MSTQQDVSRIAMRLPGVSKDPGGFAFTVPWKGRQKGFVWAWNERVDPKKGRVPNTRVLVVRVRNLTEKELLLEADGEKFFTEPHYNGYPAIHVRLPAIEPEELEGLVVEAWRTLAPKELLKQLEG